MPQKAKARKTKNRPKSNRNKQVMVGGLNDAAKAKQAFIRSRSAPDYVPKESDKEALFHAVRNYLPESVEEIRALINP